MKISRRDILKFAAGSAAGIFMTPVPWKMLDDTAIWTQNWPWIPVPPRGAPTTRFTTCTICPAGCGIKARCISGQPVSLAGVPGHPLGAGTLCPIGLGGHHLAYHPMRLTQPMRRALQFGSLESQPISLDAAVAALSAAISSAASGESVAILDQQPGRTISQFYRRLAAQLPRGVYVRGPMTEDATLAACGRMAGMDESLLGYDLEHARTIVSFGAPLFDGWGTPGRMARLADARRNNKRPTIIQVETRHSRTARHADAWIPVKPGTEAVLALGLGHVLIQEELCDIHRLRARAVDFDGKKGESYCSVLERFDLRTVADITGVTDERIVWLARSIAAEGPAIAIGGGDPAGGPLRDEDTAAIAALNFLLGSICVQGGIVARRGQPVQPGGLGQSVPVRQVQDLPDRSLRVLLLDGAENGYAIPWSLLERKLADDRALVVSLSPYLAGLSRHAGILIPSPALLESWQDVPTPSDACVSSFAVSSPLLAAPQEVVEPYEVIRKIGSALGITVDPENLSYGDHLKAKARRVYTSGRGTVFAPGAGTNIPVKEVDSAETLWQTLADGGCWIDDPVPQAQPSRFAFLERGRISAPQFIDLAGIKETRDSRLAVMPYGWRGAAGSGQVSPLTSKLYQESGLRSPSNHARVNPDTAGRHGMKDNAVATLESQAGSFQVMIHCDPSVMPGVVLVAVGPDAAAINDGAAVGTPEFLSFCLGVDGRSWRVTRATTRNQTT